MSIEPGEFQPMYFKPKVFDLDKNKIVWGGGFLGFMYQGDHSFFIQELKNGKTRFYQKENFKGLMVLFMTKMIKATEIGYHQMNNSFKDWIEAKNK